MLDYGLSGMWYHGSQKRLSSLRAGSSISRNRQVAKAFSHRPSLVSWSDEGDVKHDGSTPGYLYLVSEELGPNDVRPHPHPINVDRWEWLTNRELALELIEETAVTPSERLTDEEIRCLRLKHQQRGKS